MKRTLLIICATMTAVGCYVIPQQSIASTTTRLKAGMSDREKEIRRKIATLKRQGKLTPPQNNDDDDYTKKVQDKLGKRKSKMLGFDNKDEDEIEPLDDDSTVRTARIGTLPTTPQQSAADDDDEARTQSIKTARKPLINPDLFDSDDNDDEMSEEDLIELVAQKMTEQGEQERGTELETQQQQRPTRTSSVGGSWQRNVTAREDMYQPKTGSWGKFPRPRDISKAYGGGRRVVYSNEKARASSTQATRERLQRYREKVGIEVQSEKEHADTIQEALQIAGYAMQRGMYATAVSALEKVTKYCSTNSKVGGKVFLELAMAYEAMGRAEEAIAVYRTLSKCRIEEIKYDAKRLLYGIEAMQFMQKNVGSEFTRKKAKNTFIDTTGLANIASNFDDVYNTAYIDLDSGFYKRLTESVVRSTREARQILLRATGAGEVDRLRIVQALRSISRRFDEALEDEISRNAPVVEEEPLAVMDGKPILARVSRRKERPSSRLPDLDEFVLTSAPQMRENLNGEWRLQLLADKRGDGVKFFNTTLAWQNIDMDRLSFTSQGTSGFLNVEQSGLVNFNEKRRILRRQSVQVGGGGAVLAGLLGATRTGAAGAVRSPQQVMSVDSMLLVTRGVPSKRSRGQEDTKDYFAVWRRVEPGSCSTASSEAAAENETTNVM